MGLVLTNTNLSDRLLGVAEEIQQQTDDELHSLLTEAAAIVRRYETSMTYKVDARISTIASQHGVGAHDVYNAVVQFLDDIEQTSSGAPRTRSGAIL